MENKFSLLDSSLVIEFRTKELTNSITYKLLFSIYKATPFITNYLKLLS